MTIRRHANDATRAKTWSRDWVLLMVFVLILALIVGRLVYIQIVRGPEYASMALTAHTDEVTIAASRGTIYDRNGEVLATSAEATTISVNPQEVTKPKQLASMLASYLEEDYDYYYELVTKEDSYYTYIQRQADTSLAEELSDALDEAGLDGVSFEDDTVRVYPYGDVGSQVLGSVDPDDNGTAGLELEYDELLGCADGSISIEQGSGGLPIVDGESETLVESVDGEDIVISLDIKLQEQVEESLLEAVESYEAQGGNAMVFDAATGEIYAACSYAAETDDDGDPTGDYTLEGGKLASITDAYEPGSTFKAITAVSLVESGAVSVSSTFSVPDSLEVYDAVIEDSHDHATTTMTLEQIIAESSNVGMVLASRESDEETLYSTYATFGFGVEPATDFPFPAEAAGQLGEAGDWDPVSAATITFGQGVSVTNTQLISAYGAIEQGGTARVPHFLTDVPDDAELAAELLEELTVSSEVASEQACEDVTQMLVSVVESGTGTEAAVEGFVVAGKTGTAQISENGAYGDDYNVSFIGWLEGSSSDLVCVVTVTAPAGDASGGTVCGPVFADIMSFAAECYEVNPDAD